MTTTITQRINPERKYTISQSARYLGVHRCTIYAYLKRWGSRLKPIKSDNQAHQLILGRSLLEFKSNYRAKCGRKSKNANKRQLEDASIKNQVQNENFIDVDQLS